MVRWKMRKNALRGVKIGGEWVDEPKRIKEEVREYFLKMIGIGGGGRSTLERVPFKSITQEEDLEVERLFDEAKVKEAMCECGGDKSLGPNGLNFKFVKTFWNVLKKDITIFMREFHRNGVLPWGCNASFITLIPNVENPQSLSEFRLISLVGFTYKIWAKVLENRIKKVFPNVIDERQSIFLRD